MPIKITSKQNNFRRCGIAHPKAPTVYPGDRFTEEELQILKAEPMLIVETVKEDSPLSELVAAAKMAIDEGKTISSGKPDVKAMAEILGREVTAAERDQAWDQIKSERSE